ncbi:MAG: CheR family methyltransferase [Desulfopila sp.]
MITISPPELEEISEYIRSVSGIYLTPNKAYLLETRLSGVAERLGCRSYRELLQKAEQDVSRATEQAIIDAITTKETLFFRDRGPFDLLRYKFLPELLTTRRRKDNRGPVNIRIWSAAVSTGQEIYSIAMVLREAAQALTSCHITLLGTDISNAAISKASKGIYDPFEVRRGLDKRYLQKYFVPYEKSWQISDEIRSMIDFRRLNLTRSFTSLGKFDIIFCRNVAIYFDPHDRSLLFERMADSLNDDGFFVIGATESLSGTTIRFEPKRYRQAIFYQKSPAARTGGRLFTGS